MTQIFWSCSHMKQDDEKLPRLGESFQSLDASHGEMDRFSLDRCIFMKHFYHGHKIHSKMERSIILHLQINNSIGKTLNNLWTKLLKQASEEKLEAAGDAKAPNYIHHSNPEKCAESIQHNLWWPHWKLPSELLPKTRSEHYWWGISALMTPHHSKHAQVLLVLSNQLYTLCINKTDKTGNLFCLLCGGIWTGLN